MGKPKPPDPKETAEGQTSSNIGTAIAQQILNQTDQYTPYGSLNYNHEDPLTGKIHEIPRFAATQSLSPPQQRFTDQGFRAQNVLMDSLLQGLFNNPIEGNYGGYSHNPSAPQQQGGQQGLFAQGGDPLANYQSPFANIGPPPGQVISGHTPPPPPPSPSPQNNARPVEGSIEYELERSGGQWI